MRDCGVGTNCDVAAVTVDRLLDAARRLEGVAKVALIITAGWVQRNCLAECGYRLLVATLSQQRQAQAVVGGREGRVQFDGTANGTDRRIELPGAFKRASEIVVKNGGVRMHR